MSSFNDIPFKVKVEDKLFPGIEVDGDGVPHYSATVLVESTDDIDALQDLIAVVTPKRALGSRAIRLHYDVGDTKVLSVPHHAGVTRSYNAALVKADPKGYAVWGRFFWVDCEWIISSDTTPPNDA